MCGRDWSSDVCSSDLPPLSLPLFLSLSLPLPLPPSLPRPSLSLSPPTSLSLSPSLSLATLRTVVFLPCMNYLSIFCAPAVAEVSSMQYWKQPFTSLATSKMLQEYLVMQVDFVNDGDVHYNSSVGALSHKVRPLPLLVICGPLLATGLVYSVFTLVSACAGRCLGYQG